jgi:acetyl-CoA carboxylase biotin carboxylase subunit
MIRVAEGEKLPTQDEIKISGHSIECRISAEDPNKFIPSPGVVKTWNVPGGRDVRLDSHVYAGYEVPRYYDSMIGKLIVKGDTREKAIAKMRRALGEFEVDGIKTTIDFHKKIMDNKDFKANNFNTGYLEKFLNL